MTQWIVMTQKTQTFNQLIEADNREQALEIARSNHYDGRIDIRDDMQHTAVLASASQSERYADLVIRADAIKADA